MTQPETQAIFTSCYGRLKVIPADVTPVCISRGKPVWFKGPSYLDLAPTREMLKMSLDDYNVNFDQILARLDPRKVAEDMAAIASRVALLCWEAPGLCCHRRRVAEWLEQGLGIVVEEIGMARTDTPAYADSPLKESRKSAKTKGLFM